jgi:hypothetical protein
MSRYKDDKDDKHDKNKTSKKYKFTVDQLFPSETNKSGTKGKRLDVNTLFSGTTNNPDVVIDMSHEILIERKKKRADEVQRQYMLSYKNCWEKINSADNDRLTETVFEVLPDLPEFPEYSPIECINLIQDKLRTEYIDTVIMSDNLNIFINWKDIEENKKRKELEEKEERERVREREKDNDSDSRDRDKKNYNNNKKEFDNKINKLTDYGL